MLIDVTYDAKVELEKLLKEKGTNKQLRIYVAGYGWGGPSFGLALDGQKPGDELVNNQDFEFLVEGGLGKTIEKFTIDYSNNWLRRGFTVLPDSGGSCC